MKIYCKDCKYYYFYGSYTGLIPTGFVGCKKGMDLSPCTYYKRKWYRFGKPKNIGIADGKLSILEKDDTGGLSIL